VDPLTCGSVRTLPTSRVWSVCCLCALIIRGAIPNDTHRQTDSVATERVLPAESPVSRECILTSMPARRECPVLWRAGRGDGVTGCGGAKCKVRVRGPMCMPDFGSSPRHLVTLSPFHPVTPSPSHPVTPSPRHPVTPSPAHPLTPSSPPGPIG
jgi:hypothetical protein